MTEPQDPETTAASGSTEDAPTRRPSPTSRARRAAAAGAATASSAAPPSPRPSPKPKQSAESVIPAKVAGPEQVVRPEKAALAPGTAPIWLAAVLLVAVLALGTVCWQLATHQGEGTSK